MSNFPMDFSNFELEITNRCNLACPRCARTDLIEKFPKAWHNRDLDLETFKNFISDIIDQIEIFEFKGTMGDPIFHPKFINWIKWCKSIGKKVFIHTNGQAGKALWKKLSDLLGPEDKVILGIDGLGHDFMKYRINASWQNIETCVAELAGKTHLTWQFIIFSYNEHELDAARTMSESMGFNEFFVIESKKWESEDDWLKPINGAGKISSFNSKKLEPRCLKTPMHIVTADGFYMPCCYLIDHRFRYKTPWAKAFDIRKNTIASVIKSSISTEFFAKLNDAEAPAYCKFNCGKCNGK